MTPIARAAAARPTSRRARRWAHPFLIALVAFAASSAPSAAETAADRKAVARRVFDEIFNQGRFEAAADLYAPDFVNHAGNREVGLAEDQEAARGWRAAVPDLRMTIDLMVCEDDLVTVLWTGEGTNTGSGNGLPATGRKLRGRGVTIWRISGGRVREEWSVFDQASLLVQLGLLVPAEPPASSAAASGQP